MSGCIQIDGRLGSVRHAPDGRPEPVTNINHPNKAIKHTHCPSSSSSTCPLSVYCQPKMSPAAFAFCETTKRLFSSTGTGGDHHVLGRYKRTRTQLVCAAYILLEICKRQKCTWCTYPHNTVYREWRGNRGPPISIDVA